MILIKRLRGGSTAGLEVGIGKSCDVQWGGQGLIIAAGAKAAPPRKIFLFRPPDGSEASRQALGCEWGRKGGREGKQARP